MFALAPQFLLDAVPYHCVVSTFREKDIMILSCVRAPEEGLAPGAVQQGGIGFVDDWRRLNVAITRAKHAMWIVGHAGTLRRSDEWRELINDARKRGAFVDPSASDVHGHNGGDGHGVNGIDRDGRGVSTFNGSASSSGSYHGTAAGAAAGVEWSSSAHNEPRASALPSHAPRSYVPHPPQDSAPVASKTSKGERYDAPSRRPLDADGALSNNNYERRGAPPMEQPLHGHQAHLQGNDYGRRRRSPPRPSAPQGHTVSNNDYTRRRGTGLEPSTDNRQQPHRNDYDRRRGPRPPPPCGLNQEQLSYQQHNGSVRASSVKPTGVAGLLNDLPIAQPVRRGGDPGSQPLYSGGRSGHNNNNSNSSSDYARRRR